MRFLLRATATAMRNHDALDEADYRRAKDLARRRAPPGIVRTWLRAVRRPGAAPLAPSRGPRIGTAAGDAAVPHARGDAVMARSDLAAWNRGTCPLCGGEPDLAVITAAADRLLICGRCAARWRFDQLTCPFCLNADRSRITSFASRDGQYRLYACDVCERYSRRTTPDARRARSCLWWMEWRRCRWTRQRFRRATSKSATLLLVFAEEIPRPSARAS